MSPPVGGSRRRAPAVLGAEALAVAGRVVTPTEVIEGGVVLCEEGRIAYVGPVDRAPMPERVRVLDAGRGIVAPGLVDLQVNGAGGHDVMSGRARVVVALARFLPSQGVTSFLPTAITAPHDRLCACLTAIAAAGSDGAPGARILGAHLEGPFLGASAVARGAHNRAWIHPFGGATWDSLRSAAGDTIRLVTLAPEVPENLAAIARIRRSGAAVAIGHTDADYDQVLAAAREGATLATHAFNAMAGFHHRAPGALGAVLDCDALAATVIVDGQHVHPAALRLLVRAKGIDRVVAISDAIWLAGMAPGEYEWEGQALRYDGVTPRAAGGRLAGSGIGLWQGLRTLVSATGLDLPAALRPVTLNPARALGLDREVGSLTVGKLADLVVLDADLAVRMTVVGGELAYRADAPPSG